VQDDCLRLISSPPQFLTAYQRDMSVQKREIFGWAMYDFANSAFATTILAVIFNQYFATVVAGGERGVEFSGFHLHGASFFTFSVALSMAISAVLSPFLGAVADASASKKRFLIVFCYTAIFFTGLLYFVHAGNYWREPSFSSLPILVSLAEMSITMPSSPRSRRIKTLAGSRD